MRGYLFIIIMLLQGVFPLAASGQASADWQQRVQYEMDIQLDPETHRLDGRQRLTYYNHSPDTLRQVFYHLYFNAFHPGSMMAQRNRHIADPDQRVVPRIWNLGPDEVGYHRIETLTQDGKPVAFKVTDTILQVELDHPIAPGGQAVFEMEFASQVPLMTRRSGRDSRDGIAYSMSQWYPKMAAYDSRGWHADPYVGREFYGPYGTFDVKISLPAPFVLGATGVLQNAEDIGHGYQADSTATFTYPPEKTLTWHFRAENVHDFAWAADPDYIHDRVEGDDGVVFHMLYQPDMLPLWENLRQWVPAIINYYSERFGSYPYPQFTIAEAGDGGMEYPMINFNAGTKHPGALIGVTAHEAAHEWFYGILGSNESDYSWMDEGFTNYAANEGIAHLMGRSGGNHAQSYLGMLRLQDLGIAERMSTPADWFETNAAFGTVTYSGGQMVADMLGYVVSDSLRDAWFQEYFKRYKFRHPNPFDVEKVAEDVSGLHLDWFFEQFTHTTRLLDYSIEKVDQKRTGDTWTVTLTLRRREAAVMPIDLQVTLSDGSEHWVNIPLNIMHGHKPVPSDWSVAEPWMWTAEAYKLTLNLPQQVIRVVVDPLQRMPDKNRLNNTAPFPIETKFLHPPAESWSHYAIGYRPMLAYSHTFGIGVGGHLRGSYLFGDRQLKASLKVWPEAWSREESLFNGVDYGFFYQRNFPILGPKTTVAVTLDKHLGVVENSLVVTKKAGHFMTPEHQVQVGVQYQRRTSDDAFRGVRGEQHAQSWPDFHLLTARLGYEINRQKSRIKMAVEWSEAFWERDPFEEIYGFSDRYFKFSFYWQRSFVMGALQGRSTLHGVLSSWQLAAYKQVPLGSVSLEDQWRNDAFRHLAATLERPMKDVHLAAFSDAGPVAYLLDESPEGIWRGIYNDDILAGSVFLGDRLFPQSAWLQPLVAEMFFSVGLGGAEEVLADAGLGLSYHVADLRPLQRWVAQSDVLSQLAISARFPLWVNKPQWIHSDESAIDFRWLVGVTVTP